MTSCHWQPQQSTIGVLIRFTHLENGVPLLQHNFIPPEIQGVNVELVKYILTVVRKKITLCASLCCDQFLQVSNCVVLVAFDTNLNHFFCHRKSSTLDEKYLFPQPVITGDLNHAAAD